MGGRLQLLVGEVDAQLLERVDLAREMWGDMGRCGEMWGDVRRCAEIWGDAAS